jgi:Tetracyclin repressor-like, C-terminal domain
MARRVEQVHDPVPAIGLLHDHLGALARLGHRRGDLGWIVRHRHVADKDDLVNSVAERVLDAVAVPDGPPDDWERRVVGYLTALRQAALAHPSLSRILAERGLTVGPVFDQLEEAHAILRAAGFSELGAVRAFYTLFTYVFGFVIWELPRVHQQPPSAYAAAWNESLGRLDVTSYPTLRDLRSHLITAASSEQFDYGLRRLVDSLQPPG